MKKITFTDTIEIKKISKEDKMKTDLEFNVKVEHFRNGELLAVREGKNIITNAGKAGVASRINGAGSEAVFNYIAIGTGTTEADADDTALQSEITTGGGQRAIATVSRVTTTTTNDTAQWVITYNFTSSFAVTESGIFNAASSGTLLARRVFSAINVANGDSLQVTWKVQAQ